MSSIKTVVTGGSGFIGSHLVDRLIERGDDVIVIDNFRTGRRDFLNKKAMLVEIDIKDTSILQKYFDGANEVFHLAANADVRSGWDDPRRDFELNLERTICVAELSAKAGVESFIFTSTGSVYGDSNQIPTNEDYPVKHQTSLYSASKYACESFLGAYTEANKFKLTVMRLVSVLGPRYTHGHIYDFIQKLKHNPSKLDVLGDGLQRKSYMHVTDCVDALLNLRGSSKFEVFNLGQSDTITIKDSLSIITSQMKVKPQINFGLSSQGWIGDIPMILLDISKAKSLGWYPKIGIAEAIFDTTNWLIENDWVFGQLNSENKE